MRFFAALHVFLYHGYLWHGQFAGAPWLVQRVVSNGSVSVGLFFILSGFILSYRYLGTGDQLLDRRGFWLARFARVYPAYAAALLLTLPLMVGLYGRAWSPSILLQALMLQAWLPTFSYGWNGPGWSLSVEAFFYFSFPFVVPRLLEGAGTKRIVLTMLGLWLAALVTAAFLPGSVPMAPRQEVLLNPLFTFPLLRLPEFLIGACLGRLYCNEVAAGVLRRGTAIALAGLAWVACTLATSQSVPKPLLDLGLVTPGFALLVFGLAQSGNAHGSKVLVALGEASYCLYIFQQPLLDLAVLAAALAAVEPDSGWFGLATLFVIAASWVIHRNLELPARLQIQRRYRPREAAAG